MRAVSLFSGVGGIDLAFERAGIETVLQAERDKWCLSVLARHWPDVERVDDVADVREGWASGVRLGAVGGAGARADIERLGLEGREPCDGIDPVYGGFPCQPFSVAGARRGAADERDGWPEFRRVVSELRPRWVVAENVPGLLSIDGGRYFGRIVSDLDELGFDVAWAVLDAQHFGVPQRRRRVFIVGGPRGRGAEQVLHLCEGCDGDIAAGGEAWEGTAVAPALRASGVGSERIGDTRGQDPLVIADTVRSHPRPGSNSVGNIAVTPIAWALQERDAKGPDSDTKEGHLLPMAAGVRRLTPRECERLQGFPDDWTRWGADGRELSDSHRYRMCGNAVAVPVLTWLGLRLVAVDAL